MEFNTDKCHVLRITRKQKTVNSAKYLGVTLTSDLRLNRNMFKILYQSLGFLRRNLRINSPNLKSLAYKTYLGPTTT